MIEANQLYKTYSIVEKELGLKGSIKAFFHPKKKQIHAVQNISLTVQKGEIIGYIGSNGSGKSTTIKMLTGVLYPDRGSVKINGLTPQKHRTAVNKQIGVLFGQKSHLRWDIPVLESFILHAKIYDVPDKVFEERLEQLIDLLQLGDFIHQPVISKRRLASQNVRRHRLRTHWHGHFYLIVTAITATSTSHGAVGGDCVRQYY